MKIPKKLQSILWSTNVNLLDWQRDEYYIIHQIFAYGSMEEIRWVFKHYPKEKIAAVFKKSFKDYRKPRFYFIKNILLGLKNWQPDEHLYVKNIPRVVG